MSVQEPSEACADADRDRDIIDQFHKLYYNAAYAEGATWANTSWLGVRTHKCPLDLWVYQEILFEVRPDVIVESGTEWGGSALFFASVCDLLGNGRVITIDIEQKDILPRHERITYLLGSSVSTEVVTAVKALTTDGDRIMVMLDSNHRGAPSRLGTGSGLPVSPSATLTGRQVSQTTPAASRTAFTTGQRQASGTTFSKLA